MLGDINDHEQQGYKQPYLQIHVGIDGNEIPWPKPKNIIESNESFIMPLIQLVSYSLAALKMFSCKIRYDAANPTLQDLPLYSIPHFNFTMTAFPVRSFRNGFGLTGTFCEPQNEYQYPFRAAKVYIVKTSLPTYLTAAISNF